jgi:hypothetical protein
VIDGVLENIKTAKIFARPTVYHCTIADANRGRCSAFRHIDLSIMRVRHSVTPTSTRQRAPTVAGIGLEPVVVQRFLQQFPIDLIHPVVMRGLDRPIHHLRKMYAERDGPAG